MELFKQEHGRYPDLVVLHSNYWDIAQIVLFRKWDAPEAEFVRTMQPWLHNAAKVATYLKVCTPQLLHEVSEVTAHTWCDLTNTGCRNAQCTRVQD